jgi:hypothetical protein
MTRLLRKEEHALSSQQIHDITHDAGGYFGADVKSLCAEVCVVYSESSRTQKKGGERVGGKKKNSFASVHPSNSCCLILQSLQECMYVCGSNFV